MWILSTTLRRALSRSGTKAFAVGHSARDDDAMTRLVTSGTQQRMTALALLALVVLGFLGWLPANAEPAFGPVARTAEQGKGRSPESWLVPTALPELAARAFVYRPYGRGPFPLALIAHASTQNAIERAQMPQPDYRPLAESLVAHGFAVIIPERPGHGATAGPYREDQGGCDDADYRHAGQAAAEDIAAALNFMRQQDFVAKRPALVIGHSAGGFGALALAQRSPSDIGNIIVFAPGRGGHADDRPGQICAPERLIEATGAFGRGAKIPVTWLVAQNDSYFPPDFSKRMADAFRAGGDKVDFRILPAAAQEGHWFAETNDAVKAIATTLQQITDDRR
jgi:dienelactone hydrolase